MGTCGEIGRDRENVGKNGENAKLWREMERLGIIEGNGERWKEMERDWEMCTDWE